MKLIKLANKLYDYLYDNGIKFTKEGFPVFEDYMLLKEIPDQILPFGKTFASNDKSKTLLVSFCNDEYVYKKLFSLDKDISFYKQFLGFGGFDLSPRIQWDLNLQKFNIVLNMMADIYLALHGVKIMPNFRIGCLETIGKLFCYPKNTWYTVGTLGCARGHILINEMYLRTKLIITNPDMLIYYGVLKSEYKAILDEYGIQYKVFTDYQTVSRRKEF